MGDEFRVHVLLKTDLHLMHEIDSFVPWSIIQLHVLNRSLTSEFATEFVKAERRLEKGRSWIQTSVWTVSSFLDVAQLVQRVLVTVQLMSWSLRLSTHTPSLIPIGCNYNYWTLSVQCSSLREPQSSHRRSIPTVYTRYTQLYPLNCWRCYILS